VDQNETPPPSSARTLAIIAIVVALTAPFWEGALLGSINIHMPMANNLANNARALERLDSRTAALEQQLGAAAAQLDRLKKPRSPQPQAAPMPLPTASPRWQWRSSSLRCTEPVDLSWNSPHSPGSG
jgi:hypothetical protein